MTDRFDVERTDLPGLLVIRRNPRADARGSLERLFGSSDLRSVMGSRSIEQINLTVTKRAGTVRGMHYQDSPHMETKLVSCLRGEVFDVAIDLRKGSPTFLRWHGEHLTEENHKTLLIPEGFAHGFQTLTSRCEMLYFHTAEYAPEAEHGINPRDPSIGIAWPQPVTCLSERDGAHPYIQGDFPGLDT